LSGKFAALGIQCDDRGGSSVPLRQYTLEPAGGDVLRNVHFGVERDAEPGERPIVERVAIVNAQRRGGCDLAGPAVRALSCQGSEAAP
jgi:hypothetical protein